MTLDIREYNIIATNEGFVGFKEDMIKLYGDYVKQLVDDTYYDSIEEVAELLVKLDKIKDNYLVYVYYPYKEYCIKIVSKENYY
jgi:hypothetical protein